MEADDPLGNVEFAVLDAVHRGALRSRRTAQRIAVLRDQPAGETIFHEVPRRCEHDGLLRSERNRAGRWYALTAPAARDSERIASSGSRCSGCCFGAASGLVRLAFSSLPVRPLSREGALAASPAANRANQKRASPCAQIGRAYGSKSTQAMLRSHSSAASCGVATALGSLRRQPS